jgi:hypothetical protein
MAIADISSNLYGDGLTSANNLFKAVATQAAANANLQVAGANLASQNAFLNNTLGSLNNLPSFNLGSTPGGTGGNSSLGGGTPGGLIPVQ